MLEPVECPDCAVTIYLETHGNMVPGTQCVCLLQSVAACGSWLDHSGTVGFSVRFLSLEKLLIKLPTQPAMSESSSASVLLEISSGGGA